MVLHHGKVDPNVCTGDQTVRWRADDRRNSDKPQPVPLSNTTGSVTVHHRILEVTGQDFPQDLTELAQ